MRGGSASTPPGRGDPDPRPPDRRSGLSRSGRSIGSPPSDRRRFDQTEMYVQERRRREMKDQIEQSGAGLAEYLVSLEMTMVVGIDDADHLARLTQLTQKTNQFNLTTRRYDERSMQEFMASD